MSQVSKPVRYLLLAAWLFLAVALGMRWFDGGSPGELPEVLMAFGFLNLAFHWDGIVDLARR